MVAHGRNRNVAVISGSLSNLDYPGEHPRYGENTRLTVVNADVLKGQQYVEIVVMGGQGDWVDPDVAGNGYVDHVEGLVTTYDFVLGVTGEVVNEWLGQQNGIIYIFNPKGKSANAAPIGQFIAEPRR